MTICDACSREDAITEDRIEEDLRRLGVGDGDHVGLGISFRKIGHVRGGPQTFIRAIMTVVGPMGTIMIPSYSTGRTRMDDGENRRETHFDPERTPAYTGIVPETLRQHESAVRSRHPRCSVVALGRQARFLTESHDPYAPAYAPYSRLAECKGKVLSIGIGDHLVGFRHEAQNLAGLLDVVPLRSRMRFLAEDGHIGTAVRRDPGGCATRLPKLTKNLREMGLVTDGKIGDAEAVLVDAEKGLQALTQLLMTDPTLNLCDRVSCLWCRELERRMDLYKRIENPQIFQTNKTARLLISLVNQGRLIARNVRHEYHLA